VRLFVLRFLCVAMAGIACNHSASSREFDSAVRAAYDDLSLPLPSSLGLIVCHGFGCRGRTEVDFSASDRMKMAQILRAGQASSASERRAIAAAVAWFDRRVGPEAGTQHHVARAGLAQMSDPSPQFDCIDASRNTTSLLLVLDELHLLKHHLVENPVARGALLDGRWPHATAVVVEVASQKEWAVDSWTHAAGERPDIMPLEQWLQSQH
jgi:hypothetical protein